MSASIPLGGVPCRKSCLRYDDLRMLIYVCSWVYVADIFPTRTRHFGLAVASASQWLFNFVLSKVTPSMVTALGFKLFLMFAAINIGGMATFAA